MMVVSDAPDMRDPMVWRAEVADLRRRWYVDDMHYVLMLTGSLSLQVFFMEDGKPRTAAMGGVVMLCQACLLASVRGIVKHFDAYAWQSMSGAAGVGISAIVWQGEHMGESDTLMAFDQQRTTPPRWLRSGATTLSPALTGANSEVKAVRATWQARDVKTGKQWSFRTGEFDSEAARIKDELIAGIRNNAPGGEA